MKKYVEYTRVSTDSQGRTGLGLDSQSGANRKYIELEGGTLLKTFEEVQSGTSKKLKMTIDKPMTIDDIFIRRPQLIEAVRFCQANEAILVVFDIDRLGRSEFLISYLVQCGIKFVCSAYPQDPPMILSIRAAIAAEEARKISVNTKKALAQLKERGVKLGNPYCNEIHTYRGESGEVTTKNIALIPYIKTLRDSENLSIGNIAKRLNDEKYSTTTGKPFQKGTINYLLNH